jgi:hypothetical protein
MLSTSLIMISRGKSKGLYCYCNIAFLNCIIFKKMQSINFSIKAGFPFIKIFFYSVRNNICMHIYIHNNQVGARNYEAII